MKKVIVLSDEAKDKHGNVLLEMSVYLHGDGATPNVMAKWNHDIIGYADDGTPIYLNYSETDVKNAQAEFMAEAIKEQKKFSAENGIDPSVVNIIGAEKEGNTNE